MNFSSEFQIRFGIWMRSWKFESRTRRESVWVGGSASNGSASETKSSRPENWNHRIVQFCVGLGKGVLGGSDTVASDRWRRLRREGERWNGTEGFVWEVMSRIRWIRRVNNALSWGHVAICGPLLVDKCEFARTNRSPWIWWVLHDLDRCFGIWHVAMTYLVEKKILNNNIYFFGYKKFI